MQHSSTLFIIIIIFFNNTTGPAFSADGSHSEQMKALSVNAIPSTPSDGIGPAERVTAQVCMGNTVIVSFKHLQHELDHNVQIVWVHYQVLLSVIQTNTVWLKLIIFNQG